MNDCQACGACCVSHADEGTLADVSNTDRARMSSRTIRLHVLNESTKTTWKHQAGGPLRGMKACVCTALVGSLLRRVRCSIYAERPDVCREFEPGSQRCQSARDELTRAVNRVATE